MEQKASSTLVSQQDFLNLFPNRVNDLIEDYADAQSPKISPRTLRYYVTKGLLPKPIIKNKRAFVKDDLLLHRRLFAIWYLTHKHRFRPLDIKRTLESVKSAADYNFFFETIETFYDSSIGTYPFMLACGYHLQTLKDYMSFSDNEHQAETMVHMIIDSLDRKARTFKKFGSNDIRTIKEDFEYLYEMGLPERAVSVERAQRALLKRWVKRYKPLKQRIEKFLLEVERYLDE